MKSLIAAAFALVVATTVRAENAPETKGIEYRKFVDSFHLKDFLDNRADISSIIRFQFVLTPENKALPPHDVSFSFDDQGRRVEMKVDRYWGLDLPVSADLYERNPVVIRASGLPGKFDLDINLVVVGDFGSAIGPEQIRRARDHYDDIVSHAGFTVRNFAPAMSVLIVRGDAADGRCFIEGSEPESQAKPFGEAGEVRFDLKRVLTPAAKQVTCTAPISEVLLSDG